MTHGTYSFTPYDPKPEDYEIAVNVTMLNSAAGIAVAEAKISAPCGGPTYWLKALLGPDGHDVLDSFLHDRITVGGPDGVQAHMKHPFTVDQIIDAAYEQWRLLTEA